MLNSSSWNHSQSFHCSLFSDDSQIYLCSSEFCNELQTQLSTACSTVPLVRLAYTYHLSNQQNQLCHCFLIFLNSSQNYSRLFLLSCSPHLIHHYGMLIPPQKYPSNIILPLPSPLITTTLGFSCQNYCKRIPLISLPPLFFSPISHIICCQNFLP